MPLINCLRKSTSFSIEEQKFIINKSKLLQEKGISEKEADVQAVKELQQDLIKSLKSIHTQLDISQTKEVNTEIDSDHRLKPMRIVYKKANITLEQEEYDKLSKEEKEGYTERTKPAQILISWNIRDKHGKLINRKKFINPETGLIDLKKLPKELLTGFGFRIPNQDQNFMGLTEVVGFLPDYYVNTVIATRNFIVQMGSDFDVDKLYLYNYATELDEDGRLIKQENNIQNKLLDIHKSVLYNPKIFNNIVNPSSLGKLKYKTKDGKTEGIAEELKNINKTKTTNYLNPDHSKDKYLQSIDGKAMVGINAVGNTFLSIIQNKDLHLQERKEFETKKGTKYWKYVPAYITFSDENGKVINLLDLSSPFTLSGRKKTEVKSSYLSASVDNGNDPILSYLNHNPQTANSETLMIALGLEEELSLFSAQPSVVEYVSRVKNSKSDLSEDNSREEEILDQLIIEYKTKVDRKKLETKLGIYKDDLSAVPIGPIHFRQVLHNSEAKKVAGLTELTSDEIQLLVLHKFSRLNHFGDRFSKAQNLFNIDSTGLSKSFLELADKKEKVDNLFKQGPIANLNKVAGEVTINEEDDTVKLQPNTITGYAIVNSLYPANDTINNTELMPFGFDSFKKLFNEFQGILKSSTTEQITADQKYEVWKAVKSYIYSKHFTIAERERIFFDRDGNKSLNTRINKLLKRKLKNNPFLLRLDLSKVNVDGKLPSYVFYNAAKEEDIEERNVYQGLLDLVYSKDPEVKSVGEDLIKYFYINGGNQAAKEWGRYINPRMLQTIGLTDYVNSIDLHKTETIGINDGKVSSSLLQLFQHKIYLAPKVLTLELTGKETEVTIPTKNIPRELIRGLGITPVFSNNNRLYLLQKTTPVSYIFKEIPKLGTKFFSEYQNTGTNELVATSLLNKKATTTAKNTIAYKEKINPASIELPENTFTNPLISGPINALLNQSLKDSLDKIDSNKYNETLANLFLQLGNIIEGVKVESVEDLNGNYFGRWNANTNTITINTATLAKFNRLNLVKVEETILKESIHIINSKLFRGEFKATTAQEAAKKAITDLFQSLREKVLNGELETIGWNKNIFIEYEALVNKHKHKEPLTEKESKFLADNKVLYYGLTNVEDFMHDALLQPEFRTQLNKIKYDAKKSLLDRIGDLIAKILDGFRGLVDIKEGSALEEAFGQIFKLVNEDIKPTTSIRFEEEQTTGYRDRTIKNASADVTIALATDFSSPGEKLTKSSVLNQEKKYIPVNANSLEVTEERINNIVNEINSTGKTSISLNIAGNGIYTMKGKYTQEQVDQFTYDLLNAIINSPNLKVKIKSIRTGGQTGFDEAGAKAGIKLNIPTSILAPKGWKFRTKEGIDISDEKAFKDRFGISNLNTGKQLNIEYDLASTEIKDKEDQRYTKIIHDFEIRLNHISNDITKAHADGNKELYTTLVNRLGEVKKEKDDLIADNTFEAVVKQGNLDLSRVATLLNQDTLKLTDLNYIKKVLGTWTKIDNKGFYSIITDFDVLEDTQKFKTISDLVAIARKHEVKLSTISNLQLKNQVQEEIGYEITEQELTKIKDISWFQAKTRDISTSGNIILSVMSKWIKKANFNTVTEFNERTDRLDKLTEALQNTDKFKEKGFAGLFGQVNEEDNLTGAMIQALNAKYSSTKEELLSAMAEASNPAAKAQANRNYYNWIKDNHIIVDTKKLYEEDSDGILIWNPDQNYLKELKNQVGEEDYNKLIDKEKTVIEDYNELLRQEIKYYKGKENEFLLLEGWRLTHSPLIYLDNLKNGLTVRKINGYGAIRTDGKKGDAVFNQGWRYISKRAKTKWEDTKYNEVQADPILKEYYDFFTKELEDYYKMLPYNVGKDIDPTQIPNINKNLIEELTSVGVGKSWNRTWSSFLEQISVTDSAPAGIRDPVTQGLGKDFKFNYLNKIDPTSKSYDLTKVLKIFALQSIGYKYKSQVEDQLRLAESVLKEAVEKQLTATGADAKDRFGDLTTIKGLKHLYDQTDYALEAFYGHKKDEREGVTGKRFITPKDQEQVEKEISELNPTLPEEAREAAILGIKDKYTRRVAFGKIGDVLLKWVQLKNMGWNVFSGMNNALFAQIANHNWAAAGIDFSDEDLLKAIRIMLKPDKKTKALMIRFDIVKQLKDVANTSTSNYNKARKGLQHAAPYELFRKGEYFARGQVMVAMLNHQQVEVTENGEKKLIPLYEAFDENGVWDSKRFGSNPEWEGTTNKILETNNHIHSVLKKVHGNYDPDAAVLYDKKFLGRALGQFRRWIPEGMAQRFDIEKYDLDLRRNVKGRYRTYFDLGFATSLKTLLKQVFNRSNDAAFEGLHSDPEKLAIIKENMRKNLREIYYWLSLMGMYFALGVDDDDDDITKAAKNYAINTILRLQDDIEFYYSPMAAENITRSMLPVASLVVESSEFLYAAVETMQGHGTYKSGIHSGDQKLYWKGLNLFPLGKAVKGFIGKTQSQESFRK